MDEMQNRWCEIVEALREGDDSAAKAALEVEESPLAIVGSRQVTLLFSSVSTNVTQDDVRTLTTVLINQYSSTEISPKTPRLTEQTAPDPAMSAWEHGYELGEAAHTEFDLDLSNGWVDIEALFKDLEISILFRKLWLTPPHPHDHSK